MKILLINQAFYPDVVATAQQLTDLAVAAAREGHEVSVIASQRGYAEPHVRFPSFEEYKGVRISRVWPFAFGKKNRVMRILESLFINLSFALRLLASPRHDVIIALTSPPLVGCIAAWAAKIKKSKFMAWIMDMNPDEAIEAGWIKRDSLQAQILEKASRYAMQQAARIIVLDRFMKERLEQKGIAPGKIRVLPPWTHDEALELIAHPDNPFRKKLGLENKFVVMYAGNHSICHPLDTLLEAARQMKDSDPDVIFLFIGGGERVTDVLKAKEKNRLDNVLYLSYLPRAEIKFSLSAADVHTIVMGDRYSGIVHPSKIYGILRLGKPFIFIGPESSAIGEVIAQRAVGNRVAQGDVHKLIETLREIKKLSQKDHAAIMSAEQKLAAEFSSAKLIPELLSAIEMVERIDHE